jgi:hypothetical protein
MNRTFLATLLLAAAGTVAAQDRSCLTPEQQRDLDDRAFNATLIGIFGLVPAQLEASRARAELREAEKVAASCEGFKCDAPRVALMQAQARYESARLRADTVHENLKVKLKADVADIRATYPACD